MFSNFVTMFSNFSWYLMRPRVNPLLRNPLLVRIHCTLVSRNGKFAMKIDDSVNEVDHALKPEDYGPEGHWVVVK